MVLAILFLFVMAYGVFRILGGWLSRKALGCFAWLLLLLAAAFLLFNHGRLPAVRVHAQSRIIGTVQLSPGLSVHREHTAHGPVGTWTRQVSLPPLPPASRIVLAANRSGTEWPQVDDELSVRLTCPGQPPRTLTQSFDHTDDQGGVQAVPPLDLTPLLPRCAAVQVTVRYLDRYPPQFWGRPLWLVALIPQQRHGSGGTTSLPGQGQHPPGSTTPTATKPSTRHGHSPWWHSLSFLTVGGIVLTVGVLSVLAALLTRHLRDWLDDRGIWQYFSHSEV